MISRTHLSGPVHDLGVCTILFVPVSSWVQTGRRRLLRVQYKTIARSLSFKTTQMLSLHRVDLIVYKSVANPSPREDTFRAVEELFRILTLAPTPNPVGPHSLDLLWIIQSSELSN